MNAKALLFTIMGCIVAAFYGLESFIMFQTNGFSGSLLAKLVICGLGVYICVRNMTRIKKSKLINASDQAI
jgi:hypothetical protein